MSYLVCKRIHIFFEYRYVYARYPIPLVTWMWEALVSDVVVVVGLAELFFLETSDE